MSHRRVNQETIELIKRWEGFRAEPYVCPGGVDTIGYGHTRTKSIMKPGTKITEARATKLLMEDLAVFEKGIEEMVAVELSDGQFGALVAWSFNVGVGAARSSTLVKKLNKGEYNSVPLELAKWNKVKGKVVAGLVNRRAAEAGLWARGSFVAGKTGEDIGGGEDGLNAMIGSNTAKGAATVATISAAGTAMAQAQPVIDVLGYMSPWLVLVLIVAALIGVIIWRYKKG